MSYIIKLCYNVLNLVFVKADDLQLQLYIIFTFILTQATQQDNSLPVIFMMFTDHSTHTCTCIRCKRWRRYFTFGDKIGLNILLTEITCISHKKFTIGKEGNALCEFLLLEKWTSKHRTILDTTPRRGLKHRRDR